MDFDNWCNENDVEELNTACAGIPEVPCDNKGCRRCKVRAWQFEDGEGELDEVPPHIGADNWSSAWLKGFYKRSKGYRSGYRTTKWTPRKATKAMDIAAEEGRYLDKLKYQWELYDYNLLRRYKKRKGLYDVFRSPMCLTPCIRKRQKLNE